LLFILQMSAQGQYLDQYVWEKRVLIIYENASQNSEKANMQKRSLLVDTKELSDRKLTVLRYNGHSLQTIFPEQKSESNIDLGFTFQKKYETILIGLDGSVKTRFSDIKSPQWIFDLIDSMPMRRNELRRKVKDNH